MMLALLSAHKRNELRQRHEESSAPEAVHSEIKEI